MIVICLIMNVEGERSMLKYFKMFIFYEEWNLRFLNFVFLWFIMELLRFYGELCYS